MSKHTLTFRITDRQLTALDNAAKRAGSSREDMARSVLALGLATMAKLAGVPGAGSISTPAPTPSDIVDAARRRDEANTPWSKP